MSAVIEAQGLTRRFGNLLAVDHVSFAVEQGEVFGFLGPNGAGKTTTVRMLTGVIDPTEGTATIRGHNVQEQPSLAREHMGVVPEEANVYVDLSVWQNLMLMAELHGMPREDRRQEGRRWLEALGLADRASHKARALSKGLRRRLMLCCALITRPEVLFLDEPTSGLDVHSANLVRRIIQDTSRDDMTVFLTTHNMHEAEAICSRVGVIDKGHIVAIGAPERLRAAMRSGQYVEVRFAGVSSAASKLESLPEVLEVVEADGGHRLYTERPGRVVHHVAALCDREGLDILELCTHRPSLEEVFLRLIREPGQEGRE